VIRAAFIGDGPRDFACVPPIVERALGVEFDKAKCRFKSWREVRVDGRGPRRRLAGYAAKLGFERAAARDDGLEGVVATVDTDNAKRGARLRELRGARDTNPALIPTACGEATPHAEAWLLDDPKAVREALGYSSGHPIPDALDTTPKANLERLIDACPNKASLGSPKEAYSAIAGGLDVRRCNHRDDTGLAEFVRDVEQSFAQLKG
jgi:hypothetical protein